MTDHEIAARGQRARSLMEEFVAPALGGMRDEYLARMADVATKELDPKVRADKITALSTALRILDNVTAGIEATIMDGEAAQKKLIRAEDVERMSPTKRRLFQIAPSY